MAHTNDFNMMDIENIQLSTNRLVGNLGDYEGEILQMLDNIVKEERPSFTRQTCDYTGNPDVNMYPEDGNPYERLQKFSTPWNLQVPSLDYKCENKAEEYVEDDEEEEDKSKPRDYLISSREMLLQQQLEEAEKEIQELKLRLNHTIANLNDISQQIEEIRQEKNKNNGPMTLEELNVEDDEDDEDKYDMRNDDDMKNDEKNDEKNDDNNEEIPDYKYEVRYIAGSDAKKNFHLNGSIIHDKESGFCIIFKSIFIIIRFESLVDINFVGTLINRIRGLSGNPNFISIDIMNIETGTEYVITKYDYDYGIRRLV